MSANKTIELTLPGYGVLRGIADHERQIAIFKNVPYATVSERWRPAVKPQPWSGVRDATKQGPVCPQMPVFHPLVKLLSMQHDEGSGKHQFGLEHDEKSCLNLNIVVPLLALNGNVGDKARAGLPVMTFIHGDASNLVQRSIELNQPVLVVTVNYQLNVFGFIASRELQQEMKESSSSLSPYEQSIGNWGLMD
ncbi:hypothetical protein BGZ51_001032 [Haplosporangium sp. Z 767]|nr:hypothetical protein BGZ51_001032 [Haplosporangium sp. Z 767]KAF9193115.1 hypothetical protein BGZ50_007801 [Haplosporangium sp. Z 11]